MQLQEGDFAKDLVQELLRQLGAGGRDLPQQFIKMGMQGNPLINEQNFLFPSLAMP
jgi:hypothetical protein